mmetsp:Transcript_79688/g.207005  ORF Transcript_79688/g.207005 Transcript_79688/m.207005 type:complete len:257 (+) Transcript_79688:1532-2302(+)
MSLPAIAPDCGLINASVGTCFFGSNTGRCALLPYLLAGGCPVGWANILSRVWLSSVSKSDMIVGCTPIQAFPDGVVHVDDSAPLKLSFSSFSVSNTDTPISRSVFDNVGVASASTPASTSASLAVAAAPPSLSGGLAKAFALRPRRRTGSGGCTRRRLAAARLRGLHSLGICHSSLSCGSAPSPPSGGFSHWRTMLAPRTKRARDMGGCLCPGPLQAVGGSQSGGGDGGAQVQPALAWLCAMRRTPSPVALRSPAL